METAIAAIDGQDQDMNTFLARIEELKLRIASGNVGAGWASNQLQGVIERRGIEQFCVNRNRRSEHIPKYIGKPLFPEIERHGPTVYSVFNFICPDIAISRDKNEQNFEDVFTYVERRMLLPRCFGIQDAEEICARGPDFFRTYFHGTRLVCWKSLSQRKGRGPHVPVVELNGDQLRIEWSWLIRTYNTQCLTPVIFGSK